MTIPCCVGFSEKAHAGMVKRSVCGVSYNQLNDPLKS